MLEKKEKQYKRHRRVRAKIKGTKEIPRLSVFRSNKHIYVQLIDDEKGKTILSFGDFKFKKPKIQQIKSKADSKSGKKEIKNEMAKKILVAYEIGKLIGQKASEKKIKKVVFDRGGYKYHGRIKAVAEGAKEGGLIF